ncbi:MAG: hypothetical protein EZS28_036238, partial [Streblomastix strix]
NANPDPNNGYPLQECQSSKVFISINTPQRCTPLCTSTDSDPLIISDSCFCTDTDYSNWLSMYKLVFQNQQEYPKQIVSVFLQLILKQMVFDIIIAQDLINQMLIERTQHLHLSLMKIIYDQDLIIHQIILDLEILVLFLVFAKLVMIQLLLVIAQVIFLTLDVHVILISILQAVDASLIKTNLTHLTMAQLA